jgi:hypothetical protein
MTVPFGAHSATLFGVGPYGECLAERARATRYVTGVEVSGETHLPGPSTGGRAVADLTTSDGHRFHLAWRPFEPRDVLLVNGTADGTPFTAALWNP